MIDRYLTLLLYIILIVCIEVFWIVFNPHTFRVNSSIQSTIFWISWILIHNSFLLFIIFVRFSTITENKIINLNVKNNIIKNVIYFLKQFMNIVVYYLLKPNKLFVDLYSYNSKIICKLYWDCNLKRACSRSF